MAAAVWLALRGACGALVTCAALAATGAPSLASDPAALKELVDATLLDVMSEAAVDACEDIGAPSAPQLRETWVAWRGRHQLAPLRQVVAGLQRRRSDTKSLESITGPMRRQVLEAAAPDPICAQLMRDLQTPAMDVTALYPRATATAVAVVQGGLAAKPEALAIAPGTPRGEVMLPSQVRAFAAQHKGGFSYANAEGARRDIGWVYVKGRVMRRDLDDPDSGYYLAQIQGDRRASARVNLTFAAEAWVGREVVLRGLPKSVDRSILRLSDGAVVTDPSALTPSPLPQEALIRAPVPLQRVLTAPGQGIPDRDLAAIVIHGEGNHSNGSTWEEDVRFLLRDGSAYRRTEMPPDQLAVTPSRQLEPQRWGRWRSAGKGYEMQVQDDDGRPAGDWQAVKHHAVRPWPAGTRLDGYFSRSSFHGNLFTGSTSSTRGIRFTPDGRFERSHSSLSSAGGMAAAQGAVISGSSRSDGSGSSSTAGGTTGGAGAFSTRKRDDGAGRRGRYELDGFVLTLHYDDGRRERLLSFAVYADQKTIYVGDGSLRRADK